MKNLSHYLLSLSFLCCLLLSNHQLQAAFAPTPSSTVPMRTDADISRAIRGALAADKFIASESASVSVQVDNGIATLSGSVSSERLKNQIGSRARGVGGVRQVINNIQFSGSHPALKSPTGPINKSSVPI